MIITQNPKNEMWKPLNSFEDSRHLGNLLREQDPVLKNLDKKERIDPILPRVSSIVLRVRQLQLYRNQTGLAALRDGQSRRQANYQERPEEIPGRFFAKTQYLAQQPQ